MAFREFDNELSEITLGIHDAMNAYCVNGTTNTNPWDMSRFENWANERGANLRVNDSFALTQNRHAEQWLKAGRPVVVGIGFFEHYVVAIGWGEIPNKWYGKSKYVYANFGWEKKWADGWIPQSFFYSGTIDAL